MILDWRANISDVDSLYDLDPGQVLVFLRHQYLDTAKDMLKDNWDGLGQECCQVAEAIESALEAQVEDLEDLRY